MVLYWCQVNLYEEIKNKNIQLRQNKSINVHSIFSGKYFEKVKTIHYNCVMQSPSWEAIRNSMPFTEPEVYYCNHTSMPSENILVRWIQPTSPTPFPLFLFNIILPHTPGLLDYLFISHFPTKNLICIPHLSHACYTSYLPHHPWFK